ncbi:MAG: GNAT family N-acetyltransferase [Candidatus Acidiferrales bacterium]
MKLEHKDGTSDYPKERRDRQFGSLLRAHAASASFDAEGPVLKICCVENDEAVRNVSLLFREYAASLSVDLSFQDFEAEMAALPGDYAPPHGRLFLALADDSERTAPITTGRRGTGPQRCAGCVALRKIDDEICEMKRLYVINVYRGRKIGRCLADAAIEAAREIGYRRMRLDTLPEMMQAQHLYRELGFREISPYRYNPVVGTKFFELML